MNQTDRTWLATLADAVRAIPDPRLPCSPAQAEAYISATRGIHADICRAVMSIARSDVEDPELELEDLQLGVDRLVRRFAE